MHLPKVYADFNAIEYLTEEHLTATISLTGYGTLSSLASQKLRLREGMKVLVYEPNDIECEATVHFDECRQDPAGRTGEWIAQIEPKDIRDSLEQEQPELNFPCIVCSSVFTQTVRNYRETCTGCGASVMEPLAPPKSVA